ncbi:MAG: hypothetical protein RBS76_00410 [Acholeplasmatales bacterium]|nr:hypothetical protein [Acholeplasmataceae bacterium]MCK9234467.1 hypothetical protein [Acholeplasmataceae bacterium]MDY0114940.1 hypothetical protein [Acholeplasmatales bacterium]
MQTLKRSIILQVHLFLLFIIFGVSTIVSQFYPGGLINYLTLGLMGANIIIGIICFFKIPKDEIVVVNLINMQRSKICLYGLALSLLVRFLAVFDFLIFYVMISAGVLMVISALFGFLNALKALNN